MNNRWQFVRQMTATMLVFAVLIGISGFGLSPVKAQKTVIKERLFDKYKRADEVTRAVRDKSNELVNVKINSLGDRAKAERLGTVVEDYGSFVVLAKNKAKAVTESSLERQALDTTINLPGRKFEPIIDSPAETVTPQKAAAELSGGKNYYVVQTASIAKDEWLKSFEEVGAEVIQYIPHQAFFVYADAVAISKLTNHSRVRWVGKYEAEHKFSPSLRDFMKKKAERDGGFATFEISVFKNSELLQARNEILNSSRAEIVEVMELPNNYFDVIRVKIPVEDIEKIARIKEVVQIDGYGEPVAEDERAAQIVAGNYTSATLLSAAGYNPLSQFGVDGTGVTVSVVDDGVSIPGRGGFYLTSANTVDGPLRGATAGADGGHGHLNASIIAGDIPFGLLDPLGYNYGIGIAPKANIINIPFLKANNATNDVQSIDDSFNTVGPNGVKATISNNSWGAPIGNTNNAYGSYEALWDGLVRDGSVGGTIDPFTIIFSAGNCGNGNGSSCTNNQNGLTRPKIAKNIISVGNSENIRTEIAFTSANNMDDLSGSSSRGPAADGRIKPDIIAPGSVITGSRSGDGSSVGGQIDDNHSFSSGTSHSAPQIAGAAALFTQFWKNTNAGVYPSPAMIKAAILNTAQEMNGVNTAAPIPNGNEGWGRINMKYMLNTGVPTKYVDQTSEFSDPGATTVYEGRVADTTKPTRITLVWTDPPGTGDPALVNNLDLTVEVGGIQYVGNIFTNGSSSAGGSSDTKNNVENVFLPAGIPAGTPVGISVRATALNGNGILGNSDNTDQNFALVAYNFTEQPVVPQSRNKASDFDGDGKADVAVFRESTGDWYILRSSDGAFSAVHFGAAGDKAVPGDYDGDGKTDVAVFRNSTGVWYLQMSSQGFNGIQFGSPGDLPVAGFYDSDNKTDIAVYRPSTGSWYLLQSTAGFAGIQFGISTDKPVPGDYDGDQKTDIAVYRPSTGTWYLLQSTAGFAGTQFGISTDKVVPADFDGDGKTDIAVYRPENGAWYILRSQLGFTGVGFGVSTDIPATADFDGDGLSDITVFRGNAGAWYRLNSSNSAFNATNFGVNLDVPVSSAYVPLQ